MLSLGFDVAIELGHWHYERPDLTIPWLIVDFGIIGLGILLYGNYRRRVKLLINLKF